ncbi:MAG: RluA family pseudouridine synthase [Hyphomicrobiaceae bacterium]|nr:RluA family pseudouridine synthase [Hyphomicrobiaceae bacterium]
MAGVTLVEVTPDDAGMRVDRWFQRHYPQLPFSHLQKMLRAGHIRVDKKRVRANERLDAGMQVRVPPIVEGVREAPKVDPAEAAFIRSLILYEDEQVLVLNKPHGLAVQGGSGTKRHIDGLLKNIPNKKGEVPRLVHRLDRDTSGCLLVAKTRGAAAELGKVFASRSARKIYWAVTVGVPNPPQGRISCFLAKRGTGDGEQMVVVDKGDEGAQHSMSHYAVIDRAGQQFAWVSLKPVTGRTHQLRVHLQELGTPILDDPRYFNLDNWNWTRPDGLGEGLHLHARRLSLALPSGKRLDVTAPLPEHMKNTFSALGFDVKQTPEADQDPEEQ